MTDENKPPPYEVCDPDCGDGDSWSPVHDASSPRDAIEGFLRVKGYCPSTFSGPRTFRVRHATTPGIVHEVEVGVTRPRWDIGRSRTRAV